MSTLTQLTTTERKAILDAEVATQVQAGWRVASRTDTTAQLTRNTGPNLVIALLLLIIMILPGLLYLAFASGKRTLYLEVDVYGNIQRTERG